MSKYYPTAISYAKGGLVNSSAAFNLTDDSFQTLQNAYNFRGRIRRRQGFTLLGRLQRNLSAITLNITGGAMSYTPPGVGSQTIAVFTIYGINVLEPNASIRPGTVALPFVLILDSGGANETILTDNTGTGTLVVTGGGPIISAATINYATGVITATFTAAPGPLTVTLTMSYYPTLPCMGIWPLETTQVNVEQTIAFDTRYAYIYSNLLSQFAELVPGTIWNGSNSDFFWAVNFLRSGTNSLFFATNYNVNGVTRDPIYYYNGATWTTFNPQIDNAGMPIRLQQARILIPYRGRLVALNTWEGTSLAAATQNPQRARWSQLSSQTGGVTDLVNSWRSDIAGRGGFIDAPTSEQIISAEFIRDTLVVGFERSTWKLRYTGNELTPFVWERINRELGTESTFSPVAFDKGILSIGDKSINTCDGNDVTPIDQNIPDEIFSIHNGNDGPFRVQGIRDFYLRQVYWTYPMSETNGTFPNRMFVYDYERGSWAIFTDSFTCFGPYQRSNDITWATAPIAWRDANFAWNSPILQSQFPNIVGGNQQGYVHILNQQVKNVPSLQINAVSAGTPIVLTVPEHNMVSDEVVRISGILNDVNSLNGNSYVINVLTSDTFELIGTAGVAGTYTGGGEVERVFNYQITSKQFNLMDQGVRGSFGYLDFLVEATANGEVTCEISTDNQESIVNPSGGDSFYNQTFSTVKNTAFNNDGNLLWQRFYCPIMAQFFNFNLTLTEDQMLDPNIADSDLRIEAFIIWASKNGRLVR